jgi:hypothetical protein
VIEKEMHDVLKEHGVELTGNDAMLWSHPHVRTPSPSEKLVRANVWISGITLENPPSSQGKCLCLSVRVL